MRWNNVFWQFFSVPHIFRASILVKINVAVNVFISSSLDRIRCCLFTTSIFSSLQIRSHSHHAIFWSCLTFSMQSISWIRVVAEKRQGQNSFEARLKCSFSFDQQQPLHVPAIATSQSSAFAATLQRYTFQHYLCYVEFNFAEQCFLRFCISFSMFQR